MSEEDGCFSIKYGEYGGEALRICSSGQTEYSSAFVPAAMLAEISAAAVTVLAAGCCPAGELIALCSPDAIYSHLPRRWNDILTRFSMRSEHKPLDRYMNCWCVFQTVACRLEARTSLYQQGGAYGFRDQLQDAANLLLINSSYLRERILDCCLHQYSEGDVMHWWHGEKGLRTRCSDDLLWLVWALCRYVEATGDESLCRERVPYAVSPPLSDTEHDRYESPSRGESASVFEHAKAALERCILRGFGAHGLPYIGGGDWNDAINKADGESLWLGWFFSLCAEDLASLSERLKEPCSERYVEFSSRVRKSAEKCFNGQFYPRGYLADGSPLGGSTRIDSVSQSWAAFCGADNAGTAVYAALSRLVDRQNGLVRLLWPPFSPDEPSVGYISSYGQGIRENGGQYTHGAIWLAIACFRLNRPDDGYRILEMLLPENRDLSVYLAEPFVLPADVCSLGAHTGESGWTWYTGSSGWYFRAVTEYMLGLRLRNGRLTVSPCLPGCMDGFEARWCGRHISVECGRIRVDGVAYHGEELSPVS